MRNRLVVLILGLLLSGLSAQTVAQLSYGGGIFYGSWLRNAGLDLRAEYALTDDLIIAPKLDISFPDLQFSAKFLTELGAHVHYHLIKQDILVLYPLAGLNIQSYLNADIDPSAYVNMNFGVGLCAGAGGQLILTDNFSFFGEARYALGRYHQFMATAGVLFTPGQKAGEAVPAEN